MPSIRKGSFSLSLTYSDGNYSNNLFGDKAYYDAWLNTCELSFDLKRNFRSRNKDGNDYIDVNELNEERDKLRTIQIFDSSIASTIKKKREEINSMEFRVSLLMDSYPRIICKIHNFTFDDTISAVTFRIEKILQ